MRLFLTLLLCLSAFAGQSVVLDNTQSATAFTDAAVAVDQAWRVEFQLHNMTHNAAAYTPNILSLEGVGVRLRKGQGNTIIVYDIRNQYDSVEFVTLNVTGRDNILVRCQRVPGVRWECAYWDSDGTNYTYASRNWVAARGTSSGGSLGEAANANAWGASLAFFRVHLDNIAIDSKPPQTGDIGDRQWKFDGDGTAAQGGNNITTTAYTFEDTPDQGLFPVITRANTPAWMDILPMRAGHENTLDGSGTFSTLDSLPASLSYLWQQIPHEAGEALTSTAVWSDRTAVAPTVTGLVFGPYKFRLAVSDGAGTVATADKLIGAVSYDDNGVVIYPDERLYTLIGPQMVSGQNPWEWADERFYTQGKWISDSIVVNGGTKQNPAKKADVNGYSISGTVYWNATTRTRTIYGINTQFLGLFCGGVVGPARGGTTGGDTLIAFVPATIRGGASGIPMPAIFFVQSCQSDTEITVNTWLEAETNPNPSPGVEWGVWNHDMYPSERTGTLSVTNGSATVTGTEDIRAFFCDGGSSAVTAAAVTIANKSLTVTDATNASPIVVTVSEAHQISDGSQVWVRNVGGNTAANANWYANVLSSTTVALYGGASYSSSSETWSFSSPSTGNGAYTSGGALQDFPDYYTVSSCSDANTITLSATVTGATGGGLTYIPRKSAPDLGGWSVTGGTSIVFYDTPLALYRRWYSSGDYRSLKAARYLVRELFQTHYYTDWGGFGAIFTPVVSPILAATVDTDAWEGMDPWPTITKWAQDAANARMGAQPPDQRESSYAAWQVALLALYHPDADTRASLRTTLGNWWTNQISPYKLADGSYPQLIGGTQDLTRVWQVANGSASATLASGSNISSDYCGVPYQPGGTISISADGYDITGTGTNFVGAGGKYILLTGTLNGEAHSEISYIETSPAPTATTARLRGKWRGDVGSVTSFVVMTSNSNAAITWEESASDGTLRTPRVFELDEGYVCTYVSPTEIVLDRPYEGDTSAGNTYRVMHYQYYAVNTQPFMMGLMAAAFDAAHQALDGYNETASDGFLAALTDAVNYVYDTRDTVTNGQNYYDNSPWCEPRIDDAWRVCTGGDNPRVERDYTMEIMGAAARLYLRNPSETLKTKLDSLSRWMWARPGYDAPVAGDGDYLSLIDESAGEFRNKATGQAFGHGGGTIWPAARLGGQAAAVERTVAVSVATPFAYSADQVRVTLTKPDGSTVSATCGTVPCSVTGEFRAGENAIQIDYLKDAAVVATASAAVLVQ